MVEKQKVRGNRRQTRVYLSLGSNQGDRVGFIQQAMQLLKDNPRIRIIECSSLYETEPPVAVNYLQWFVNAVAVLETDLSALELLMLCKEVEQRLTSMNFAEPVPASSNSKAASGKIIDFDILFFGNQVIETDELQIPHPKIENRAYALVPLLEVSPELTHPKFKKTIAQLHEQLPMPELIYLYGTREESG
jgi:2-amino-4-hydroxy-6-hydroxymethyldihydropteridine diphosphokinase